VVYVDSNDVAAGSGRPVSVSYSASTAAEVYVPRVNFVVDLDVPEVRVSGEKAPILYTIAYDRTISPSAVEEDALWSALTSSATRVGRGRLIDTGA